MTDTTPNTVATPTPGIRIGCLKFSEQIDKIAPALVKLQSDLAPVQKAMTAKIRSDKGNYEYSYADLASVWEAAREPLPKAGFYVMQGASVKDRTVSVTTMLIHESGQWAMCELTLIAGDTKPQSIGSAITYGRRYGMSPLLGIVTEEDDDGGRASRGKGHGDDNAQPKQKSKNQPVNESNNQPVNESNNAPPAEPHAAEKEALRNLCGVKTVTEADTIVHWITEGAVETADALRDEAGRKVFKECWHNITAGGLKAADFLAYATGKKSVPGPPAEQSKGEPDPGREAILELQRLLTECGCQDDTDADALVFWISDTEIKSVTDALQNPKAAIAVVDNLKCTHGEGMPYEDMLERAKDSIKDSNTF